MLPLRYDRAIQSHCYGKLGHEAGSDRVEKGARAARVCGFGDVGGLWDWEWMFSGSGGGYDGGGWSAGVVGEGGFDVGGVGDWVVDG